MSLFQQSSGLFANILVIRLKDQAFGGGMLATNQPDIDEISRPSSYIFGASCHTAYKNNRSQHERTPAQLAAWPGTVLCTRIR